MFTVRLSYEAVSLILGLFGIILIPAITLMIRSAVKWAKLESKVDVVIEDLKKLVQDKDKVHNELTAQLSHDREATDKRLRWLEQHLWRRFREEEKDAV